MTPPGRKPVPESNDALRDAAERSWNPLAVDDADERPAPAATPTEAAAVSSTEPSVAAQPARLSLQGLLTRIWVPALALVVSVIGAVMTWGSAPTPYAYPVGTDWGAIHFLQVFASLCAIVNGTILVIAVRGKRSSATPASPESKSAATSSRGSWMWTALGIVFAILLIQANLGVLFASLPIVGVAPIGGYVPRTLFFGFWMSGVVTALMLDVIAWRIVRRGRRFEGRSQSRGWIEMRGTYRAGRLERFESGQRMPPVPLKISPLWMRKMSLNE